MLSQSSRAIKSRKFQRLLGTLKLWYWDCLACYFTSRRYEHFMAFKNPTANRQQAYSGATESLTHLQYSIRMYEGVYLHLDDLFTFHI